MTSRKKPADLRSARWFAPDDFRSFGHRSRMNQMGYSADDYVGRPVVGIINTWSDLNQCHAHFKSRVEDVKRGVLQAGGFPVELPALSLSESKVKPTTMLYRTFLAMETEELIRSHPIDAAVLMGGRDKTTPGLILGATSADVPAIFMPAGPMLRGTWHGTVLGSGSDTIGKFEEYRAGTIDKRQLTEIENGIARSYGVCMTMGTASTMTGLADALGMTLPGASSILAADAGHIRMASATGRRAVEMAWEGLTPAKVLTEGAFRNAIVVAMAMGCSTNALIHLIAMARRAGHPIGLDDFDRMSRSVPVIANVRPSGKAYLMEDFFYAGGFLGMMSRLKPMLDLTQSGVSGQTWNESLATAQVFNDDVIRPLDNPIYQEGALAVLRGNIAPDGCVIKPAAAAPHLLKHSGKAMVFEDYPDLKSKIDRDDLDVTPDSVLVLKNGGPQGGPGMPEWGTLPIPRKLLKQGVRDMLRISDARMSGTAYGACVLHVSPESYVGGPLAVVRTGDMISIDVPNRTIRLEVSDAELAQRLAARPAPPPRYERGYGWMFSKHIRQAHEGCDFDFLETSFGAPVSEPVIF
ncbi:MAG: L-arabinonate dehydratase [Beijerinckiaceae bacterium]